MKKLIPKPSKILMYRLRQPDIQTHKRQVRRETKTKVRGAGGEEVGYQSTWHLGQVDMQADTHCKSNNGATVSNIICP